MVVGQILLNLEIKDSIMLGVIFKTMYAPRTIKRITNLLPSSAPATKLNYGLAFIIEGLSVPGEYQKKNFAKGEIGIEVSSGNIVLFLEDIELDENYNFLGGISSETDLLDEITSSGHISLSLNQTNSE